MSRAIQMLEFTRKRYTISFSACHYVLYRVSACSLALHFCAEKTYVLEILFYLGLNP